MKGEPVTLNGSASTDPEGEALKPLMRLCLERPVEWRLERVEWLT